MPLSATGWHADRALGATEWYGRAPQARRPGAIAIATATPARCFCDRRRAVSRERRAYGVVLRLRRGRRLGGLACPTPP